MTQTAIFLSALLTGFLIRLAFSVFEASDAEGLRWRLERLRPAKWLFYRVTDSAAPAEDGYPVLFHWLLSKLPPARWVKAGFLINAFLDITVACGVCAAAAGTLNLAPFSAALMAAVLFLFAPALYPPTARLMAFNGRAFGLFLFAGYLACLGHFLINGFWTALGAAAVLFVAMVLASQFAFQAAAAVTLGLALSYRSWAVVLAPALLTAAAAFVPGAGVKEPLRYFAGLYRWQYANRKNNTAPAVRSLWLKNTLREIFVSRRPDRAWPYVLLHSPQILTVLYAPAAAAALYFYAAHPAARALADNDPLLVFCLRSLVPLAVTALVTGFSPFSIFGQAERYMEYAAPPAAILCARLLAAGNNSAPAFFFLFVFSLLIIAVNLTAMAALRRMLFAGRSRYLEETSPDYAGWFAELPAGLKILPVPLYLARNLSSSVNGDGGTEPRVRFFYDWLSPEGERPLDYMSESMSGQTFTPEGMKRLAEKYAFDGAFVFKDAALASVGGKPVKDWTLLARPLDGKWEVFRENDRYCLLLDRRAAEEIRRGKSPAREMECSYDA